jgi:hypothetical protein
METKHVTEKKLWVIKAIKRELKDFLETNVNGNTRDLNLWDTTEAALRGKYAVISTYMQKQKAIRQTNDAF